MVPKQDDELMAWARAFREQVEPDPGRVGLSEPLVAQFSDALDRFILDYNAVFAEGRTKGRTAAKESAKRELLVVARAAYAMVKSFHGLSAREKIDLGVHVDRNRTTPVGPPGLSPVLSVGAVRAYTVSARVSDRSIESKRRRANGAAGAMIMSFVGAQPPPIGDVRWTMHAQVTRAAFAVTFPATLAPGTLVWLSAAWYTRRGERSAWCDPIATHLQGATSSAVVKTLPPPVALAA
jgi:hypothetical protein